MTSKDNLPPAVRRWLDAQHQLMDGWSELLRESAEVMRGHAPEDRGESPRGAEATSERARSDPRARDEPTDPASALAALAMESWEAAQRAHADWFEATNAYAQRWMRTSAAAAFDAVQGAAERDRQWRRYIAQLQELNMTLLGAFERAPPPREEHAPKPRRRRGASAHARARSTGARRGSKRGSGA